jgi:hypothetical protein
MKQRTNTMTDSPTLHAGPAIPYRDDTRTTYTILRIAGTYHRLAICEVAEGESGRQEMHGPLVEGPWAATFGLCSVITSYDRSEEIADEESRTIDVQDRDMISISGNVYRIEVYRREFIRLVGLGLTVPVL